MKVDSHTDAQKYVVYVAVRDKGEMICDPQTNKYQNDVSTRVHGWKAAAKVDPTPVWRSGCTFIRPQDKEPISAIPQDREVI
jgi:hypothetical protein